MSTEQRRIALIRGLLRSSSPASTAVSAGVEAQDDCAVLRVGDIDLVFGSDFVRGEGFYLFKLGLLSHYDIGYYLVGANASDLAAMGADPLALVTVVRYSPKMTDEEFEQIMTGVVDACREFALPLVGGDTGGYELSVLSGAAIGTCEVGTSLRRSNASIGEYVYCTGDLGIAGAAIAYFVRAKPEGLHLSQAEEDSLLRPWRRVAPNLAQGKFIRTAGFSRCAIDTSDGLKAACRQLAESSDVSIVIEPSAIPIPPLVGRVAAFLGVDPIGLAVGDSVDFRLVFTAKPSNHDELTTEFERRAWPLYRIGTVEAKADAAGVFRRESGRLVTLPGVEWSQSEMPSVDILRGRL